MRPLFVLILLLFFSNAIAQTRVYTQDINNFFAAFDSIQKVSSASDKLKIVQTMYVDKGSEGLKEFIRLGGANTERWLKYMQYAPKYLAEMRPYMEEVKEQLPAIEEKLKRLKDEYPAYKDGNIYFFVGVGYVGGSAVKNNLILGTEKLVKKNNEWAVPTAIHEFIHLQQKDGNNQLLSQTVKEGMADFLSELYFGKDLASNGYAEHTKFGREHEKQIWELFKKDMFLADGQYHGWLFNSKEVSGKDAVDLGYFVGYQVCKRFYETSHSKEAALKEMLELDFTSNQKLREFVLKSNYLNPKEVEFVVKSEFTSTKTATNTKKKVVGYSMKGKNIVFTYSIPPVAAPLNLSIAGTFNNWNPDSPGFALSKKKGNVYELTIPKEKVRKGPHQFKFVLNGDVWIPAPENALNVDEKSKDRNLTLTL